MAPQTPRTRPRQPPQSPPDYPDHLGFILAEEDALKTYLEGAVKLPKSTGVDDNIRVWYRYPDAAHATTYPFVTIDLIGVEPAFDLHTSEYDLHLDSEVAEDQGVFVENRLYDPSMSPKIEPTTGMFFRRAHYITYRLYYQVGLWTNNAVHDRLLTARMIRDVIGPRPRWLLVPADQVWRRLEFQDWAQADVATQEGASKRIFRKIITLSIQTDISQDNLDELELQPYIQKLLYRVQETTMEMWDTGSATTPPSTTTNPPTEWWETIAHR